DGRDLAVANEDVAIEFCAIRHREYRRIANEHIATRLDPRYAIRVDLGVLVFPGGRTDERGGLRIHIGPVAAIAAAGPSAWSAGPATAARRRCGFRGRRLELEADAVGEDHPRLRFL